MGFRVVGGSLGDDPAEFTGRGVKLLVDTGSGPVVRFAGRIVDDHTSLAPWTSVSYRALGLRYLGDRVPHTDHTTGSDASSWNLDPTDTLYDASKAGRTLGEILTDCLSFPANAAGLDAYGVGAYASTQGYGGAADAGSIVSAALQDDCTVTNGGGGYDPAHPPNVHPVGGNPSTVATLAATVAADGTLSGVSVVDGAPATARGPRCWFPRSLWRLSATWRRLISWSHFRSQFRAKTCSQRSRANCVRLRRIASCTSTTQPAPSRFLDARKFGSNAEGYGPTITLQMNDPAERLDVSGFERFRSVEHAFGRTLVRGAGYTECKMLESHPPDGSAGSLEIVNAHDGLTDAEAEATWKYSDFLDPYASPGQATGTATINTSTHVISALNTQYPGYKYSAAPQSRSLATAPAPADTPP